jgi:hypothetical protein
MVLVVGLAGLALLAQPERREATPDRAAAVIPARAVVRPAAAPRPTPADPTPAEATAEMAPADHPGDAEGEDGPVVVLDPDIVVALEPPAADDLVLRGVTYVHTSESAQPMGPAPPDGGAVGSSDASQGPEAGDLFWFGPAGLVRLAREARR